MLEKEKEEKTQMECTPSCIHFAAFIGASFKKGKQCMSRHECAPTVPLSPGHAVRVKAYKQAMKHRRKWCVILSAPCLPNV
jgi:hypothetical protein